MLHFETIEPATLELLRSILSISELNSTRLVGGTSLALQLGHRKSVDLDFFGKIPYNTQELSGILSSVGNVKILQDSKNIHIFLINGVKVDFVNFEFEWRQPVIAESKLRLAGIEDIAAMKITAVIGRGSKKDFIDIANILETYTLSQVLAFYQEKYPNASSFMALKSLLYFDDAEKDIMPIMIKEQSWHEIKEKITRSVNELS